MSIELKDLKTMVVNDSVVISKTEKEKLNELVNKLSPDSNSAYQYKVSTVKNGIKITRIVPETLLGKNNYANTLTKTYMRRLMKYHENNKTKIAGDIGLSRRTVGRIIEKMGLD